MSSLAEQQAALTKEKGKITKFFKSLKKFISKEFLWILIALVLGLPLAFLFFHLSTFLPAEIIKEIDTFLDTTPRFVAAYAFSLVGIYFTRSVIGSIETLIKKEEG